MLSVLKTILSRLDHIEKQLNESDVPAKSVKLTPVQSKITVNDEKSIASTQAKTILLEAKDEAFRIKREAEDEVRKIRQEAVGLEQRIITKEDEFEKKIKSLEDREKQLAQNNDSINKRLTEIDKYRNDLIAKLEGVAKLTRDEAKNLILKATEDKLKEEIAKRIKEAESQAKQVADQKAREILVDAMKHGATDYVPEYTVSTIKITDEDFKGRIIGKEGRNIRSFEMATGVDVDLDEEGVIRLSSFDPVRREI